MSSNRQRITNALFVLTKIGTYFPYYDKFGQSIAKVVQGVVAKKEYDKSALKVLDRLFPRHHIYLAALSSLVALSSLATISP
jgi:hypothetical protein